MKCFSFRLLAFLALVLAGTLVPAQGPFAQPPTIITADRKPIQVEVGKGVLVHLEHRVTSVFVADPDVADVQSKSPTLIYLFGKSGGETTLFGVDDSDHVILNATIRVAYDVARLQERIHELVPRSAVSVNSVGDALVLDGTVYSSAEGEAIKKVTERFVGDPKQLVNRMKVDAPNQVNLRVRVAEISRDIIKQFGFNWDAATKAGNFTFGLASGNFLSGNPPGVPGDFFTRSLSTDLKTTVDNLFGAGKIGAVDLSTVIDALDNEGLITVLAEPNLTAVSGEPASFLAGGEFPVPVSSNVSNGIQTVTVEWKKFGVSLSFVATIGAGNRISLRVMPEVSELSNNGAVVISNIQLPALTTRRADTTVELASGQSLALAGLLQNNVTQNIKKFPWLGDVPILGQLFRSEQFRRQESELVIIVTPYVVRPTTVANRLQLPTDGFVNSSDGDLVYTGSAYKPQALKKSGAPITRSGAGLIGPVGFDLD
jgi:pilus assembly protein CpaC